MVYTSFTIAGKSRQELTALYPLSRAEREYIDSRLLSACFSSPTLFRVLPQPPPQLPPPPTAHSTCLGNGATQCGLGLPASVTKLFPYRHAYRLTCSRQFLTRLFLGNSRLCQVDRTNQCVIKVSNAEPFLSRDHYTHFLPPRMILGKFYNFS